MKRIAIIFLLLPGFLVPAGLLGQEKGRITREDYVKTYADLAMREMVRVGIPASITLAQGCLESDNGNSTLAVKGNNHFGIKCHDWTGRKIRQDDDSRNECFRSYDSPYESYVDHSDFLTTKDRYADLFGLKPYDYRGWARGLKKAGYATADNYAGMLIQIIEDNELYRYDLLVLEGGLGTGTDSTTLVTGHGYHTARKVLLNNRIEYVVVEPGDTPGSLRNELDLYPNEIYRYNDLFRGVQLEPGQVIYLQPKRRKAAMGNEIHVVKEGQTMYDISQIYGVKVKYLYRMNLMKEGAQPLAGAEIYLRKKRQEPILRPERIPEPAEDEIMYFRFEEGN
jgi:LysM repeat protein